MQEVTPEQAAVWRVREQDRFDDGTYTRLPTSWRDSRWYFADDNYSDIRYPDHFAHISIDKVSMIAFTENEQKGVRDRQTRMAPGKYLARFFSDVLTPQEIQAYATDFGAQYNDDAELMFATTADEFEKIYTSGPRSCMSHDSSHFNSNVHPVRVYAGFDLSLAYLKREGRITARALCWPAKLRFGRLYGDSVRLQHALEQVGYRNDSLSGAKITKKMQDGDYIIPYLDYLAGAIDKGDHLLLSDGTHGCCDIEADRQNGLSAERYSCSECGENMDEDDARSNDNGDYYCEDCWSERYAYCHRTDQTVPRDEIEEVRTRQRRIGSWQVESWGEYARSEHAFYCERDDVWYSDVNAQHEVNGVTWGPDAIERDAVFCEGSEEYVLATDSVTLEDGTVWSKDHFAAYGVTIDGLLYDQDNAPNGDQPPVRKASPTVVCDAQVEAPLEPPAIVVGCLVKCITPTAGGGFRYGEIYKVIRVYGEGDRVRILVERDSMGSTTNGWGIEHFVFHSMPLDRTGAQPIVAGCWVTCLTDLPGEFTNGGRYKVTRLHALGTRIFVEHDDQGRTTNGWRIENFVFHSMPAQTGLHIRHEPTTEYPFRIYDGDQFLDQWSTEEFANSDLARYRASQTNQQPEEVAL